MASSIPASAPADAVLPAPAVRVKARRRRMPVLVLLGAGFVAALLLVAAAAPLDAYRVALQVDEHDVAFVRSGQRGEMVLASMPGERFAFQVRTVTPVNTSKDGKNYFRVEGQFDAAAGARLRPGMEGVAKVSVQERRLIWIWTRNLVNWARLKAWTWLP